MGITSQFTRPINARLNVTQKKSYIGHYEVLDGNRYFWADDTVFICNEGELYFVQEHPLDSSIRVHLSKLEMLDATEVAKFSDLPSGNNNFSGSTT